MLCHVSRLCSPCQNTCVKVESALAPCRRSYDDPNVRAPHRMSGLGSEDAQTLWSILKSIQRREEQRLREHAEDSAVSRDCMAQLADLGAALGLLETNHQ